MISKNEKIFIANRGEILRRIAHTANAMGIATASLGERDELGFIHGLVDEVLFLDEPLATAHYLDPKLMIALARRSGCTAIHPGFGFLSENVAFAEAVIAADLVWIGPNPKAMQAMASKTAAQGLAAEHGVPTIAGIRGLHLEKDRDAVVAAVEGLAKQVGYPLLVKAALGGGGKGMRIISALQDLVPALERASSEALAAFGDRELIVEKYLSKSRHVEVQVLSDRHGQTFIIGDRDCSLQRRHQKIIEESPAPALGRRTRDELHAAAQRLASAVGYDSTGTVEFLVNWEADQRGRERQDFYFLEMNTRLQVEHPVSEQTFNLDLVHWQILCAFGQRLPAETFSVMKDARGHSVEVRLYAEDPDQNFLPAPGPIHELQTYLGAGVRWEKGVEAGSQISSRFDPMIAKLIVWGEDRAEALCKLEQALKRSFYFGPPSNWELLTFLCSYAPFADEAVTTDFAKEHLDGIVERLKERRTEAASVFSELKAAGKLELDAMSSSSTDLPRRVEEIFMKGKAAAAATKNPANSEGLAASWLPTGAWNRGSLNSENTAASGQVRTIAGRLQSHLSPNSGPVSSTFSSPVSRSAARFCFYSQCRSATQTIELFALDGFYHRAIHESSGVLGSGSAGGGQAADLTAPVPGKVVKILKQAGDTVSPNEKVMILESMKMEYELAAAKAGKVQRILVKEGEQVAAGQQLLEVDDEKT